MQYVLNYKYVERWAIMWLIGQLIHTKKNKYKREKERKKGIRKEEHKGRRKGGREEESNRQRKGKGRRKKDRASRKPIYI